MIKDEIMKLALAAYDDSGRHTSHRYRLAKALEAALPAIRRAVMEEGAKVAGRHEGKPLKGAAGWTADQISFYEAGQLDATASVAAVIRALAEKPL